MSLWNDDDRWSATCSGAACPICERREPMDVVAKLDASWVTMQEAAPVPSYVCLVSQTHAVDLHNLPEAAVCAFMRDARKVSNGRNICHWGGEDELRIHGNSIPHFHMHFFPRYRGDQFEGQPINPRLVVQPVYPAGEFERTRDAFVVALASNAASPLV